MQSRGKKSNLKIGVAYIALGVFLLACLIGGLYVWYVFLPAFVDLIICLGVVFSLIIIYFLVCRGVFLSKNSCYELTDEFLIYKDGYPNSKKYVLKLEHITCASIKAYRFAFLITACVIFTIVLVLAIVLGIILSLKILFIILIILAGLLISGYFIALHFLSLNLAKCKIYVSEKKVVLRHMEQRELENIVRVVGQKVCENEI